MKRFLILILIFQSCFSSEEWSIVAVGSVQATDTLLENEYGNIQYDTFVGQTAGDIRALSRQDSQNTLVPIPEENEEERQDERESLLLRCRRGFNVLVVQPAGVWWNTESSCCGSKPYPGKCHCCMCGVFCSIIGVTALCLWYLKDFHPPCEPDNC